MNVERGQSIIKGITLGENFRESTHRQLQVSVIVLAGKSFISDIDVSTFFEILKEPRPSDPGFEAKERAVILCHDN